MKQKIGPYKIIDLPAARREVPNLLELYWWKHSVYGLIEVDVTLVRQFIAEHKERTGEGLSFTGYLAYCLARAIDEDKSVQAFLKGRRQLVVFDDVDVGMTIERQIGETRAPTGYVIRGANHKTYLEIHQEIRAAQAQPVPTAKGMTSWLRTALLLPWPLPKVFGVLLRLAMRRDPTLSVAQMGTVGITAVGMFGHSTFWGITPPMHTLLLIIGSITRKPTVVDDHIEPREILNVTVAFDHDVIDGAPAARFGRRLVELIESGYGLDEMEQASHPGEGYAISWEEVQLSRPQRSVK